MVDAHLRIDAPAPGKNGRHQRACQGRRRHGSIRLDRTGRRQRRTDRSLPDVARHARTRIRATGHRRTDRGLQPAKDPALRAKVRGRTLTLRRRPDWTDPVSDEPRAPDHERDALDDGTGRLPHDAIHRRRVRDPRLAPGQLVDRQSGAHPLRVRRATLENRRNRPANASAATANRPKTSGSPPTPL